MRRHRGLVLLGSGVVVVLAAGAVAVRAATAESTSEEIQAAVGEFFEARQDGDCRRVLAAVSVASWSEGGRLDQEGFLERCPDVVGHYQPALVEVRVVSVDDDDDAATVQIELPVDEDLAEGSRAEGLVVEERDDGELTEPAYADGRVVREDGQWKVEMDDGALGLGPSVSDNVLEFLEAYRDGNCEVAVELVSDEAWSGDGGTDRAGFLDDCSVLAGARERLLAELQPNEPAAELLTVLPEVRMPSGSVPTWTSAQPGRAFAVVHGEGLELVVEDLRWKIASMDLVGTFARAADYARLDALMVDEVLGLTRTDLATRGGSEFPDLSPQGARPAVGLVASFGPDGGLQVELHLYELGDADAAAAFAQHLAGRDMQRATRYNRFPPAVPDPAVSGVAAVVRRCDSHRTMQACTHGYEATAVAAHGAFVVDVSVSESGEYPPVDVLLGHAVEPLTRQLESLVA